MRVIVVALGFVAISAASCRKSNPAEKGAPAVAAERPCASTFGDFTTTYRYDGSPATCSGPPEMLVAGCPSGDEISNVTAATTTWRTFTYDRSHRLVAIEIRTTKDGPITTRTTYAYGAGGLRSAAVDRANDGTVDTTISYQRAGDTLVRTQDTGADGKPDLTDTQRFDAAGRLTSIENTRTDGGFASTTTFEWTGNRLVAQHIDVGGTKLETRYLYDCATTSSDPPPAGSPR